MPRNRFQVRPLDRTPEDLEELREEIDKRIVELNDVLQEIELFESQLRGEEGFPITFRSDINMSGKRIRNAGISGRDDDLVTRKELIDAGIYNPNPLRPLVINRAVEISKPLTIREARSRNDAATLGQVRQIVTARVGAEVATIKDGQTIDLEDLDGTDGATAGTLLFAASREPDGSLKARAVPIGPNGILFHDAKTHELLELLLGKMDALLGERDNVH